MNTKNILINKKDLIFYLLIIVAVIIFFYKIIFTKNNFFIGDIYAQFYPWKEFIKNSIQSGSVPFWDPFTFSGFPFLADIQKGVFYPLGIIFIFFDFSIALKLFIIIHFFLMGFFTYSFFRILNFSRLPAIAGSFLFMFNTFTVSKISFFSALSTITFIPILLFLLYKFLYHKKIYDFILFVLILAIDFLAGYPPIFYYTIILLFSFWIYLIIDFNNSLFNFKKLLNFLLIILILFFLLVLLTLPQTGPFYELILNSHRISGINYNEATADSLNFSSLFSFLIPAGKNGIIINGYNDWIYYSLGTLNFFSTVFVFFFILSFFLNKNKLIYFSYILILIAILLSLGKNTPFYSYFYIFCPFFSTLRHPGLAMSIFLIPASIILAFSLETLLTTSSSQQPTLFYSYLGIKNYAGYINTKFCKNLFYFFILFILLFIIIILKKESILTMYNLDITTFKNFILGFIYFILFFGILLLLLFFKENFFITSHFYFILLIFILFFELFYFSSKINPLIDDAVYSTEKIMPESVNLIKSSVFKFAHTDFAQKYRTYPGKNIFDAQKKYLNTIPSNTGYLYGLQDALGYNPIILKNYKDFISDIFSGDKILNKEKLNLLNVKYIFTINEISDYQKLYDSYNMKIYYNKDALPVFFVSESKDEIKLVLTQSSWGRKNENDFNNYKIDLSSSKDGYFIFSNNYYPGWKAFVDNKTTEIEKCFSIYMGIKINAGQHTIIFKYYPTNFDIYLLFYYVICLILLFLSFIYIRTIFKSQNRDKSYFWGKI